MGIMERQDLYSSFEMSSILKKVIQHDSLTASEHLTLDTWLKKDEKNRIFFESLQNEENLAESIKEQFNTNTHVQYKLVEKKIRQKKKLKILRLAGVAAAFFLAFGTGIWFFTNNTHTTDQPAMIAVSGDILPGSNKATIKLSSGQSIDLNEHEGIHITDSGFTYNDGTSIGNTGHAESATLITPRGGQYQITLSDGTKVWLNANSSLQYPLAFNGKHREVQLKGEGYFEVAHNAKQPFIVKTDQQQIKVLGTAFNVRAYTEKQYTTLLRGSVAVNLKGSTSTRMLKPGEQAIVQDYSLSVGKIDVTDFVAWKDGIIAGTSVSLKEILSEIERWYDVDFKYAANFTNSERAYININKNEKLSSVLKALENTYGIRAEIRGKEVIIK